MRRAVSIGLVALLLAVTAGCAGRAGSAPSFKGGAGKVKVATSFYPMYEFTKAVGGDKVDAVWMVPPGTEPHDWEPTPRHMELLDQAALFVYNGAGLETWADKALQSVDNKSLVTVNASRGLALIPAGGEEAAGTEADPHVWLDPENAIAEVTAIRDGLIRVDKANQATYQANAAAYVAKLTALDADFRAGLANCRQQRFFTSHAAFAYLAKRYGLQQEAIMGLAPDAEPRPQDLAKIVAAAKASHTKYIFFETLVNPKLADMVAQEAGAGTLVLNPLEGLTDQELKAGEDYLTVMRQNLTNLKTALECGQ